MEVLRVLRRRHKNSRPPSTRLERRGPFGRTWMMSVKGQFTACHWLPIRPTVRCAAETTSFAMGGGGGVGVGGGEVRCRTKAHASVSSKISICWAAGSAPDLDGVPAWCRRTGARPPAAVSSVSSWMVPAAIQPRSQRRQTACADCLSRA